MKKLLQIIAIIVLVAIINGLSHSIYDLWHKQDLITLAKMSLEKEKEKNEKLKSDLKIAQTPEFVESQARNNLFLIKDGEKEVLVPKTQVKGEKTKAPQAPNWKKWLNLFF